MTRLSRGFLEALLLVFVAACNCGKPLVDVDGGGSGGGGDDGSVPGTGEDGGGAVDGGADDGGVDGGGLVWATDGGCGLATCASVDAGCGPVGDGCGSLLDCGKCPPPQTCGGDNIPFRCGGDAGCIPRTCQSANADCGPVADGCGGILNCGICTGNLVCGGGGAPSRCGLAGVLPDGGSGCVKETCASIGSATCGPVGDGCGGSITCPGCAAPAVCGGGGTANQCGGDAGCHALTCNSVGANCGVVGDGCGGTTASCGTCQDPDICGGAGTPSVCGHINVDAGPCTNLCLNQTTCGVGTTTITGVVYAPTQADAGYGNPDPLPGALVYVPNSQVFAFDAGVRCEKCSSTVTGDPLVFTTSAVNGSFTLSNVPCNTDVPVVIQLGRWRRQITVPGVQCCANTALTPEQTRLPRKQGEFHPNDNIPLIAVVTGDVDVIECLLPKIGIASDQYSLPSGNGRVRFYQDNGANFPGGAPASTTLYNSPSELAKYDMLILDCVGAEEPKTAQQRANLENYANSGGRIFASHFGYVWLFDQPTPISFTGTASWITGTTSPPNQDAFIDTSFARGQRFGEWVYVVGAQATTSTPAVPKIRVDTVRYNMTSVNPPAERWVYGSRNNNPIGGGNPAIPLQYTFNAPTGAQPANQCGRVLFSDFHVHNATNAGASTFPGECAVGPLTPQEKVFEYLLFDLASCITPYIQSCTPRNCQQMGANCGPVADGCGGIQDCGTCQLPQTCGGGGTPSVCGAPPCTPVDCAAQGFNCGPAGNGCGGQLDCGTCVSPLTCGGGGVPGVCGNNGTCTPRTCQQQNLSCGPAGDGCGSLLDCGACNYPNTCGGGGTPGVCGHGSCSPRTCQQAGANCGGIGDGCGGAINCGACVDPDTCGGGGVANVCGSVGVN